MTEETMPASTPAATTTTQADHAPAQYYEPAETPEHEELPGPNPTIDDGGEEPEGLGDILDEARPKKLSGAQRAKLQRQYLESELSAREQRIAELERHIGEREENDRQSESERAAEAQRKRDEAHVARIKGAKGTIADFDIVMAKMAGVPVHEDLVADVLSSDKSELLTYHLANHPDKIQKLNSMSPTERARELGRLEATLKLPEGKRQTSAPPPPSRLSGGAAPHTKLEEVNDMGTFAKRLIKDLDARKRR